MSDSGYVKVFRDLRSRDWYRDAAAKAVYLELLLTAAYEQTGLLKPGQAWCSVRGLAERLGLSERQVRTAIKHLVDDGEITTKSTKSGTIATLTNWQLQQGAKQAVRASKPAKVKYHTPKEEKTAKNDYKPSDKDREYIEMLRAKEAERAAEKMRIREQRLAEMSARENAC